MAQQLDFSPPPPRIPRQSIGGWLLTKLVIAALTWPFILGLSALVGYRPSAVDSRRYTGERGRWPFLTAASVVLWLSGAMAVVASFMLTPIALVVVVPLMALTSARVASSPYGLPVADLVTGARDLWGSSPRWRKAAQVSLGALALAAVLGIVLYVGRALYWSVPGWLELVGVGAVALATLLALVYAREIGARHRDSSRGIAVSQHQLAAAVGGVFGMQPEKVLEAGLIQPLGDDAFALSPIPPSSAMRTRDEMEARVAHVLPEMTITDFQPGRIVIGPAPKEVRSSRDLMQQSSGLIVGITDEPDTNVRPFAVRWSLAAGTSPAQAAQAQALARSEGLALVEWAPYEAFAIAARLTSLAQQVRAAVAAGFGVVDRPWEVEVEVVAGDSPDVPVAEVRVIRTPSGMADRRVRALTDALLRIPGGNTDWKIEDDLIEGTAVLTHRPKRVLPGLVRLAEMDQVKTDWNTLPIGFDAHGAPVSLRLGSSPHALLVGPTGSGKSVVMTTAIVAALQRGHDVLVLDAMKAALDFMPLEPWVRYTGRALDEVAAALVAVYGEGTRRKAILKEHRVPKWTRLPEEVRAVEGIKPITIVVDEYTATIIEQKIPNSLAKDSPLRLEAEADNALKAYIAMYVGKIAREMRYVGLHLQIALQRPDTKLLDGEVRQNLGARVQLITPGEVPARESLGMVLTTSTQIESAYSELSALDDGFSPGIGVVAGEAGASRVVRVAFADETELAGILSGVPQAVPFEVPPLDLGSTKGVPKGFGVEIVEETVEEEFDISDFSDFDPSDFE